MTKTLLLLLITGSISQASTLTASRGYLLETQRNSLSYSGITDDNKDVGFLLDFYLRSGKLTQSQYSAMEDCMPKKNTHAIQVIQKITPVQVPTPNGRTTTIQNSEIEEVNCVYAPGFLSVWRRFYNAGNAN